MALCFGVAFAEQPDKWVRYVESTGSQWVDTGITGRWNTKIVAQVEWMSLDNSVFVGCGDWMNNTHLYFCYCHNHEGEITLSQGTDVTVQLNSGWNTRFEKSRIYNYTAMFSARDSAGQSTGTVEIDGVSGWSRIETGLNTGMNLYVFANNRGGDRVGGKSKSRCYGLKIYQGTVDGGDMVLVRDFQPCMKSGRAGLYDAVSKNIFYSISGTDLVCDENSEVPDAFIEYVESQGPGCAADGQIPAYIDTGIIGRAGTSAKMEMSFLSSGDQGFLESRNGSNRFYLIHNMSHNQWLYGYGNYSIFGSYEVGRKYYVDTTLAVGAQVIKIGEDGPDGETTTYINNADSATVDTGYSMYLFARNNQGTPDLFGASRLYWLKIWQDGNLVRDFRPCLKNGVAGLYDEVSKRIFYSCGTPLIYNNIYRESVDPKDVAFVEYIESDGNNTLDTGVPARSGLRAKGEMAWMAEDENGTGKMRTVNLEELRYLENVASVFFRHKRAYLGAWNVKSGEDGQFHLIHEADSNLKARYGSSGEIGATIGGANVALYVTTNYSFDVSFMGGSQTVEWNGVQVLSTNFAGNVDTDDTLHLFSSSHWRWRSAARCHGLEIYLDGTLVRDFKPCICEENGVFKGMLYDAVTQRIYRPSPDIPLSRTGPIVLSGDEKPTCYVDYVETDGRQFVDTGVIGKAAVSAEFKETSLQKGTGEECFLGAFGNEAPCYLWCHADGYTAGMGYGECWRPVTNDVAAVASSAADANVYKLNAGDTTHARVAFAVGSQTFSTVGDDGGNERQWSVRSLGGNVDTGRNLYLFAKNDNGAPKSPASSRFYYLRVWRGDSDGANMQLVRDFRPVRFSNGLVALWDSVEKKPYFAQSVAAPFGHTTFPVVGPDGGQVASGLIILAR